MASLVSALLWAVFVHTVVGAMTCTVECKLPGRADRVVTGNHDFPAEKRFEWLGSNAKNILVGNPTPEKELDPLFPDRPDRIDFYRNVAGIGVGPCWDIGFNLTPTIDGWAVEEIEVVGDSAEHGGVVHIEQSSASRTISSVLDFELQVKTSQFSARFVERKRFEQPWRNERAIQFNQCSLSNVRLSLAHLPLLFSGLHQEPSEEGNSDSGRSVPKGRCKECVAELTQQGAKKLGFLILLGLVTLFLGAYTYVNRIRD